MKNFAVTFSTLLFIGLLLLGCQKKQSLTYQLTPQETLQKALSGDYLLDQESYTNWSNEQQGNYLLVDLRTPAEINQNPIAVAENIPIADILEKENLDLLHSKDYVLLFGDVKQANGVWLLLSQLGFDKVKILETTDVTIASEFSELARYDFAAIFNRAKEQHAKDLEAGKPKPVVKKVIVTQPKPKPQKKKVVEEEEGC